ncbi:16S rRNA (guanine(966)-N(2))-methyltransferase RsmD [Bacillota bacterium Meth-B3]|nr:16S rRNA (guanine(966)-N(2))-methyltransferase RsmD [Christensenellaceae bacterium]MEA5068522.1 16S rRNA (guanine(966)-N(2))-methyltransferase RsmD [Christensenellaceae bacterium]
MRIIAGEARGRKLFAPEGVETRPTADRVRESLFNVIARRVDGARVLDLFAGSGALSFEALSRGARFAVLNDPVRKACDVIRRNAESLGWQDRILLHQLDWRRALARQGEPFDLVFLDPPYRMAAVCGEVAAQLHTRGLLSGDALLVMEHLEKAPPILPDGFCAVDARRYGDTAITLVQLEDA